MTDENLNKMHDDVLAKELDVSKIIAKLNEEGYIPNKTKEQKLQWCIILLGAINNMRLFNQNTQNKLFTFYIKLNRL